MKHEFAAADLIVHSGKIITLDANSRICEAMAIAGDTIVRVGRNDEIFGVATPQTKCVDLQGKATIPGLVDVHAHLDREGLKSVFPSLSGALCLDDVLQRISDLVRDADRGDWIVTMPLGDPPFYNDPLAQLSEGRYPTRHDLDRVAPNNPVYIRPVWGYWRDGRTDLLVSSANTKALELAGITRLTEPPSPSVVIEKDPATGEPTGVFYESTAMPIMELTLLSAVPGFTEMERTAALERSVSAYNAAGTTGIFEGHGVSAEVLQAYKALRDRGALNVRARLVHSPAWQKTGDQDPAKFLRAWAAWLGGAGLGDEFLSVHGLHAALGPDTDDLVRACAHPYTGWAGFYYDCGLPRERQIPLLIEAARLGIRPVSISMAFLDIYDAVNKVVPIVDRRWAIQHVGYLTSDQISRIRDLGLVVSPLSISNIYKRRGSGGARTSTAPGARMMPLKSLATAGVPFGLATDNLPASLFHAIWHAVARRDQHGAIVGPEEERLSREEALRAATRGGAFFTFEENRRGSLAQGMLADFVVLSDDPMECEEEAIRDIRAEITFLGGKKVYTRTLSAT